MSRSRLTTCPFNIPQLLHHHLRANDKYLLTSCRHKRREKHVEPSFKPFRWQCGSLTVHRLSMKKNLKVLFELQVESCSYSDQYYALLLECSSKRSPLKHKTLSPFITQVLRCKGEGDYGLLLAGIILISNF